MGADGETHSLLMLRIHYINNGSAVFAEGVCGQNRLLLPGAGGTDGGLSGSIRSHVRPNAPQEVGQALLLQLPEGFGGEFRARI